MTWSHHQDRAGDVLSPERGVVGGLEVLPFGVLIFVVGSLLIANAWAVVDVKLATTAAAREAARSYVESDSAVHADVAAQRAATDAITSYGRNPAKLELHRESTGPFVRCSRVTYVASYEVPAIALPFGVGLGGPIEVRARHSEIVDPLRRGLPAEGSCGG
ncbi:MAG: hypothetical protein JO291_08440 [Acidimicrobiia bacterium]|nr:hypothetical protein [Acidimicrobiia bacterium]